MLYKTRAICLHTIKYSDNSIIVNVYTEKFGRQSYMVKGVYGKKSSVKSNLFAPLNLLELEVYHKSGRALNKLKEAANNPVFLSIPFEPLKISICFFIAELLYKVFQEEIPNDSLFQYVFNAIQILDVENDNRIANFHLAFLTGLSKYLGFFPENNFSLKKNIFDLINGQFVDIIPYHGHFISQEQSSFWSKFLSSNFNSVADIKMEKETRSILLEKMIEYYRLHIAGMSNLKSLQVIKDVFND